MWFSGAISRINGLCGPMHAHDRAQREESKISGQVVLARTRFAALKPAVDIAFAHSHVYPWRALAAFALEKVFSDLIEATLGAVYIDTSGDLKVCEALLRRFGILGWLEMALKTEANIWHPKEELGFLAKTEKVKYLVWIEEMRDKFTLQAGDLVNPREEKISFGKGKYWCKLFVGEREVCSVEGWNRTEVETAAAERLYGFSEPSDPHVYRDSFIFEF